MERVPWNDLHGTVEVITDGQNLWYRTAR